MNSTTTLDSRPRWMKAFDYSRSQVATSAALLFVVWIALSFFDGRRAQGTGFVMLTATIATVIGVGFFQLVAFIVRRASSYRPPHR